MAVSSRWGLLSALSIALVIACGGDDEKDPKDTTAADGSAQQSDAGGRPMVEPGGTTTAELAPQVVGKACESDGQCEGKGGRCLRRLTSGSTGMLAEDALGTSIFLDNPGGYCSATCMRDSSCGSDGVCFGVIQGLFSGECRKRCTADSDCRDGYECAKMGAIGGSDGGVGGVVLLPSTCQPKIKPAQLPAGAVGKACTAENASSVCGGGSCAAMACTGACLSDSDCGAGARCNMLNFYGTLGLCVETCSQDSDCNQFSGESGGIGCMAQGTCGPKVFPLQPGVVGKECTDRTQCGGSAECATMLGSGMQARPAPGGYCSLQGCSMTAQCGGGTCIGAGLATRCYKSCTADGDCRSGYTCQDRMSVERAPSKVCAPAATTSSDAGAPPAVTADAG